MKMPAPTIAFKVFVYIFMGSLAFLCLIPLLNVLAYSLSSQSAVTKGIVFLWPKEFTIDSYRVILREIRFLKSFLVSALRVVIGTSLSVMVTLMMAYPLSKNSKIMPGRNIVMWILLFVMLFNGGLVPTYILMKNIGLYDNYLILILPALMPIFNVILIMNFIRMLPSSLEEAAIVDGAGYWNVFTRIILPLSKPAITTITLFTAVGHWNDYFTGLIYLSITKYPLQTYLFSMNVNRDINNLEQALLFANVSDKTLLSAQMFVALIPMLIVYPFMQKHFVKGIVLGSVKE